MHRRFRGAGVTVPCNLISESDSLGPGDSDPGSPSDDHHADDASHRDGQTVSDPDRQAGQHTLDSDASASHCLANLQPRGPELAVTVMVAAAPGLGLAERWSPSTVLELEGELEGPGPTKSAPDARP